MELTNLNKDRKQRRNTATDLSSLVYGKIPPQAKDIEEALLGSTLMHRDSFNEAAELIKAECFYVDAHQKIFNAMQSLSDKHQPIDINTVVEELKIAGELEIVGGPYYITKLTNSVVSAAHNEHYCRIILQKYVQRELIRLSGELMSNAYEDAADAFELMDEAEVILGGISSMLHTGEMMGIDTALVKAIQKIEEWRQLDSTITGVPSGFSELDKATRGWQDTDLIILSARPSVGKTALSLSITRNAAKYFHEQSLKNPAEKKHVAFFSLEMEIVMLVLRMLSAESGQLLHRIQTGRLDNDQMKALYVNGIRKLSNLNIKFDDSAGLTIQKLKSKTRKLKRKGQLGMIIIDYLQLMTPRNSKAIREQQVSEISRELKLLAKELEVPIIALSQMSREIEKRTGANRVPQLSDLRESGSLEQDADVVLFLWGPDEKEVQDNAELQNRRYLRIAKARNGMLIRTDLEFKDEIQFFSDLNKLGLGSNWKPVAETGNLFEKKESPFNE